MSAAALDIDQLNALFGSELRVQADHFDRKGNFAR
jgi:hypothetical protein